MAESKIQITYRSRFASLIPAIFLCLFFSLDTFAQPEEDNEIINVESSLVVLNAAVTDSKGAFVTGLKQRQFQIFEDGIEQKIEVFEAEESPFAAVILIDTSGSMESRISMARAAAINFLDGLRTDDMVAIYTFDSKVTQLQDFSQSRDIPQTTYDIKARGMTTMYDAIFKAAEELSKRSEKRKAIIVLSDGADNFSKRNSNSVLKAALSAGATIYTVDMASMEVGGSEAGRRIMNSNVLQNLAEKSGGRFMGANGEGVKSVSARPMGLRAAFESVLKELGNQYTIGYQPTNSKKDGKFRSIEVKVTKTGSVVRARKGYNAAKAGK